MSLEQPVHTETPKEKSQKRMVSTILRVVLRLVGIWCVYLILMHQGVRVVEEGLLEYPVLWGLKQAGAYVTSLQISTDVFVTTKYLSLGELKDVAVTCAGDLGIRASRLQLTAEAEEGINRVRAHGEDKYLTVSAVAQSFGGEHWYYDELEKETRLAVNWIEGGEDCNLDVWSSRRKVKQACKRSGTVQDFRMVFEAWLPGHLTEERIAVFLQEIGGECRLSSGSTSDQQELLLFSPRLVERVTVPKIGAINIQIRSTYDPTNDVTMLNVGIPSIDATLKVEK